jgi:hypothetical protein
MNSAIVKMNLPLITAVGGTKARERDDISVVAKNLVVARAAKDLLNVVQAAVPMTAQHPQETLGLGKPLNAKVCVGKFCTQINIYL